MESPENRMPLEEKFLFHLLPELLIKKSILSIDTAFCM